MEFWDDTTELGTATVTSGVAELEGVVFSAGVHAALFAVYDGDEQWTTSMSADYTQTVLSVTSTTLTSSAGTVTYGQPVTLTATLAPTTATGKVAFYDGTTVLGTATLSTGVANFTTSLLASGARHLKAYYEGDSGDVASNSNALTQTITPVAGNGFQPPANLTTGNFPYGVAIGDFNGDGIPDFVVANYLSSTVSVFLSGGGTWAAGVTYPTGTLPSTIAVADFNGDGYPDLAVTNTADGAVSILLGVGNGTFGTQTTYATGGSPLSVAVGDFNGDGFPDLAVANSAGTTISILLGAGDGTFGTQATYTVGNGPIWIAVGDFNGDGIPDLAVANFNDGTVDTLQGVGDGTFQTAVPYSSGANPRSVAVGDFNGDGHPDLAVVNQDDETVSIFLNSGTGTFAAAVPYSLGSNTTFLALADFNGDGFLDIATSSASSISVLTGIGDGTFNAFASTDANSPAGIVAADFNGDGVADLATTDTNTGLQLFLGSVATTTTLTSSLNPSTFNDVVTFTATISNSAATGNVTFEYDSNGIPIVVPLTSGVATLLNSSLPVGTHSVTATYSGDSTYAGSTSLTLTQNVLTATGTTLISSLNPSSFGTGVTFTATISNLAATGTVTFEDTSNGNAVLGSNPVALVSGVASVSLSSLSLGTHSIVAIYSGDSTYAASTSSAVNQHVLTGTTTGLVSSLNPSTSGASVTFTATISNLAATGTVAFEDASNGNAVLGSGAAALSSGVAFLSVSSLSAGTHYIIAVYSGDSTYAGSTSSAVSQHVLAATTTGLVSSLNPSTSGASVTFTATISNLSATGAVTFEDASNGNAVLGSGAVTLSSGVAFLAVSSLSIGTHSIIAVYSGDSTYAASTSSAVSQNVLTATTTGLVSSLNPSTFGATVTFTATISNLSATGAVAFEDASNGNTVLGSGAVSVSSGIAFVTVSSLSIGTHSIIAIYSGDSTYAASTSSAVSQNVIQGTTTVLTSSASPVTYGHTLTLTATLAPTSATGKVTFYDGTTVVGTATLVSGIAHHTTTLLASGVQSLKAYYEGDSNDSPSSSTVFSQTITPVVGNGFQPATTLLDGDGPLSLAVGDFNGDGVPDFAVTNKYDDNVSVFLSSAGAWAPAVNYSAGPSPVAIALGDFNGDGFPDMVVVNQGADQVFVRLGNSNGTFGFFTPFAAGSLASSVAVGDFNRDGIPDIAVTNKGDNTVSILLGIGDGTFSAQTAYPTGSAPVSLAVGDFNGDGIPDLAIVNNGDNTVSVLLGSGTGSFGAATNYATGLAPVFVVAADFNGDNHPDLAVVNATDGTVSILLNDTTGLFLAAVPYAVGAAPVAAALGDFNADGFVDLAVSNSTSVSVLLGTGVGTFGTATPYGSDSTAGIVVADFNGDGIADIATADMTSGLNLDILMGAPVTTATTTSLISSLNPSTSGTSVTFTATISNLAATGTVTFEDASNADAVLGSGAVNLISGVATLAVTSLALGTHSIIAVYSGDSTYAASTSSAVTQQVLTATTNWMTSSLNPAAFGASITFTDTISNLAATGTVTFEDTSNGNAVLGSGAVNLSSGIAAVSVSSLSLGAHAIVAVYSGDSTYAGSTSWTVTQHVVTATTTSLISSLNPSSSGASVTFTASISNLAATGTVTFEDASNGGAVLGSGPVTLISGIAFLSVSSLSPGNHLIVAVYSGDSTYGVSTSDPLAQDVTVVTTTVLTSSASPVTYGHAVTLTATLAPISAAGKVTFYDGTTVLGTASSVNNVAHFTTTLLASGVRSLKARYEGDESDAASTSSAFSQTVTPVPGNGFQTLADLTTGSNPSGVAVGDFNGDGVPDFAVTNQSGNTVSVFLSGSGTWAAAANYNVGAAPLSVAVGDFNGDGYPDLAVVNQNSSTVSILLGSSNGTFAAAIPYAVGYFPSFVLVGDFNGDGIPDLAVTNQGANNVSVLLGVGDGTFGAQQTFAAGNAPISGAVGDFNGDGFPDLAVVNNAGNNVSVLLGAANGAFAAPVNYPTEALPIGVAVGDFNRDGHTDLAVIGLGGGVSIFLNTGAGTFSPAVSYPIGGGLGYFIALGDFNGDGYLDLAITTTSSISVMPGVGDGTFGAGVEYGSDYSAGIVVADFNSDGIADIAAADQTSGNSLKLLFGLVPTTTTLISSANPSFGGSSVTFTATISNSSATGTVTFEDASNGNAVLGSGPVTLVSGIATLPVSSLSVGSHSIISVYSGDSIFSGSTSSAVSQSVLATGTILTSSPNPSTLGASVTLTATVVPSSATGTITFKDGTAILGSGPVTLTSGVAILSLTTLSAGPHSLTAVYSGDINNLTTTSAVVTQTVNPRATVTTLTTLANPAEFGQSVGLTATVSPASATGTITFKDGSAILFTGPLTNGVATLAVQTLASGPHALTAVYSGDASDAASTGVLSLQVDNCGTTTESTLYADSTGGPQVITVTSTAPSCSWNASTASGWIQLSTSGGVGTGSVTATLAPNSTGAVLTGVILIGGQSIAVTQRITPQVFEDVPPSVYYFDPVNALYNKHITAGCASDPLIYCPDMNIPRWQMAVFVVRAVFGGDNFTAPTIPVFNDVPSGSPGFAWIQEMSVLGITEGCGNGDFCPNETVARDQMAVFVIRMRYGATALFDFPPTPYFTDVTPETFGWSWIQRMKEDSITNGCTLTTFCPTDPVTRGEMAVFVMSGGFNYLLPAGTATIASISPAVLTHGGTGTFTVTGLNTNFVQGITAISPIPGITIGAVTVASSTSLTVEFTAASDAVLQPVSIQAITATEEAVLPNSLVIQ
jgi:hypothetical protein